MRVNILGTEYTIAEFSKEEYAFPENCDGCCDSTSKTIVILSNDVDSNLDDYRTYKNKVMRHEIIHAFLNESGLQENFEHANRYGHEETMIDWIAYQFPKMLKVFEEAGCM